MVRHSPWLVVLTLTLGLVVLEWSWTKAEETPSEVRPVVVRVALENQSISPITGRHLLRAIEEAEQLRAECLIVVLDTPGGLVDSTRVVVQGILRAGLPVVVYVAPSGGRAASAGVFITLAAHVSAMAPGTNIGAAYPVQIGGLPGAPPQAPGQDGEADGGEARSSPLEAKSVNDTVAWARALAELHDRDADWAARAVKESLSASASEAIELGVVDLLANDLDDLLSKLDGRNVSLPTGTVTLRTADAQVIDFEMWWGEQILAVLTNPNVAFLLLIVGFYGIVLEFYSPGWGVSGTLGIVCLLLGFFALAILPINYVGLLLIAVALAMFVAEVFVVSFGALTIAGIACLILGGLMLVDSPAGFQRVSLNVLIPVAVATAAITLFLVGGIIRAHRQRSRTGDQGMIGLEAVAIEDFAPTGAHYAGTVQTHGELWNAISAEPVAAGSVLKVQDRQGLTLRVQASDQSREPTAAEKPDNPLPPP